MIYIGVCQDNWLGLGLVTIVECDFPQMNGPKISIPMKYNSYSVWCGNQLMDKRNVQLDEPDI